MLTELCQEIHNWFDRKKVRGKYTVSDGTLVADFLQDGQYYRIIGSVFNDGVHQYPSDDLKSETFEGEVWSMAIPPQVVQLAEAIDAWRAKYGQVDSVSMSPYQSESFGGYSYTKASTSAASGSAASTPTGWKSVFASELNRWRKI